MNDKIYETFSKNLEYWLSVRGKNQADMYKYMEVSSAVASDWCKGKKIPRADKLVKLSEWLMVDVNDLITDSKANISILTIGEKIKLRREQLGISQTELAELMGYSGKTSISKIESRGNDLTMNTIKKFARALDMSVNELIETDNLSSPDNIGERIKNLRKQKGMTLEQLGKIAGVGKSTVRKWENGIISNMRADNLNNVSKALGTDVDYLMGIKTEENNFELIDKIAMLNQRDRQLLNDIVDSMLKR